eukprot:3517487-Heterocapsa_arctica.AAC.1
MLSETEPQEWWNQEEVPDSVTNQAWWKRFQFFHLMMPEPGDIVLLGPHRGRGSCFQVLVTDGPEEWRARGRAR